MVLQTVSLQHFGEPQLGHPQVSSLIHRRAASRLMACDHHLEQADPPPESLCSAQGPLLQGTRQASAAVSRPGLLLAASLQSKATLAEPANGRDCSA